MFRCGILIASLYVTAYYFSIWIIVTWAYRKGYFFHQQCLKLAVVFDTVVNLFKMRLCIQLRVAFEKILLICSYLWLLLFKGNIRQLQSVLKRHLFLNQVLLLTYSRKNVLVLVCFFLDSILTIWFFHLVHYFFFTSFAKYTFWCRLDEAFKPLVLAPTILMSEFWICMLFCY